MTLKLKSKENKSMTAAIVALLTALLTALVRFWPSKSPQREAQDRVEQNRKAEENFRENKDTSDLGDVP